MLRKVMRKLIHLFWLPRVWNWCEGYTLVLMESYNLRGNSLYVWDCMSSCWRCYLNWSLVDLSWWYDCWALILFRQKSKPSIIPAVEVEPPGCSFNPSLESHQVILWYVIHILPMIRSSKSHGILMCSYFVNSGCLGSCRCRRNAESL